MQRNEVVTQDHPAAALFPTAAARRMARCRARRRKGLRCYSVQLHDDEVEILTQLGLLSPDERTNCYAVVEALHRFFDQTLGQVR
jgi:hypothetical protein